MMPHNQLKGLLIEVINRREQLLQYMDIAPTLSDDNLIDVLKLLTCLTDRLKEADTAWRDLCLWCTSARSCIEDEATRRGLIDP